MLENQILLKASLSITKIFKQYKDIHPFTDLEHFGRTQHDKEP